MITRFADENNLPRDWMNTDFVKTASYSDMLTEVSRHFCWLNNKSLEIRTVSGVYLIAMKMVAHRDYRNDFSDAIGILLEETEAGTHFSYNDIEIAYQKLYHKTPDTKTADRFRELCAMSREELKRLYDSQKNAESLIRNQLLTYLEDGADINTHNITEVIRIIREKMDQGS